MEKESSNETNTMNQMVFGKANFEPHSKDSQKGHTFVSQLYKAYIPYLCDNFFFIINLLLIDINSEQINDKRTVTSTRIYTSR